MKTLIKALISFVVFPIALSASAQTPILQGFGILPQMCGGSAAAPGPHCQPQNQLLQVTNCHQEPHGDQCRPRTRSSPLR